MEDDSFLFGDRTLDANDVAEGGKGFGEGGVIEGESEDVGRGRGYVGRGWTVGSGFGTGLDAPDEPIPEVLEVFARLVSCSWGY